jgi:hypothetical protein
MNMDLPLWLTLPIALVAWFEVLGRLANVAFAFIVQRTKPKRLV